MLIDYINPFAPNAGYTRHVRCDAITSFILCDCKTGYIQDLVIYMKAGTSIGPEHKDCGKSGRIVMSLVEPYLGKGHTLYVDNCYTSPALFDILYKNFTNAYGIVKERKIYKLKLQKLQKGGACFRSSVNILDIKWHNKKENENKNENVSDVPLLDHGSAVADLSASLDLTFKIMVSIVGDKVTCLACEKRKVNLFFMALRDLDKHFSLHHVGARIE